MKIRIKRIVAYVFLIACIVVNSSSFTVVKANNDTFDTNEKLSSMVKDKLGQGSYTYEYLLDFENESRYILVRGVNSYLIFDTFLEDYVEFSTTNNSCYDELSHRFEKVYLAPTYYFYKDDETIYDLYDGRQLSLPEINQYSLIEQELKDSYCQFNFTKNGLRSNDDDPTYITSRYYFDNLRYNIGSNTSTLYSNSCSYVALGMMLSYFDSIVNDNAIAEIYDVTSTSSFISYSSIVPSDYTASPGINDIFHSSFIQYGRNLGLTGSDSNGILVSDMDELIESYFSDRNLSVTTYTTGLFTNKSAFCKNAINSDNPVYISILGTDANIDPDYINHGVVGYGYDNSGIYVHFGWKNNYHTNTNINNYTINNAFYFSFNNSHSHSNNYVWTFEGCSGTVCPCGNIICSHGAYSYTQFNTSKHKKICNACNYQQNENHQFQIVGENQVCIDCGYISSNHNHNYTYTWLNYFQHRMSCECGVSGLKSHILPADAYNSGEQYATCLVCGGSAYVGLLYSPDIN